MGQPRFLSRFFRATACAVALVAFAAPASAKGPVPAPRTCTASYDAALDRALSGRFREARDLLLQCAKPSCGKVQKKCAAAAEQAGADLARVAIIVNDPNGEPLVDVLVKMDGGSVTSHLDGHLLTIDPGVHEFTFGAKLGTPARYVWLTRKIMVVQGQREPITVSLPAIAKDGDAEGATGGAAPAPASGSATVAAEVSTKPSDDKSDPHAASTSAPELTTSSPPPPPHHPMSPVPWIVGGAGVLGVGAGVLLTAWGRSDNSALSQCSPNCAQSSVDHIHSLYIASDVSFAVGGAALAAAAYLFLTSHPKESPPTSADDAKRAQKSALHFDVQPTRSGAFATFGATF